MLPARSFSVRWPAPGLAAGRHLIRPRTTTLRLQQVQTRGQVYFPGGGPRYSRFQRASNLRVLWYQNPTFRYGCGIAGIFGAGFYLLNQEIVSVSGRRRFNIISAETEENMAKQMYQQVMQEFGHKILPAYHPASRMVQRVLNRLIPSSGLHDVNWEVHVIDDPQKNAFVIPGGKVFVFSGILPICKSDDGLATVLGHEIAHNVAHHAAERMSQTFWVVVAMYGLAFLVGAPDYLSQVLLDLGFMRPGSRKQESEADYIGLMMMAQSCYNPDAAVGVWGRMEKAEEASVPAFLSTHPASHKRMEKMKEWLPEAYQKRAESDCSSTLDYANDFKRAFGTISW